MRLHLIFFNRRHSSIENSLTLKSVSYFLFMVEMTDSWLSLINHITVGIGYCDYHLVTNIRYCDYLPALIWCSNTIDCTEGTTFSDTLRTWEYCHCNQIVTVARGSLVTNKSFGACQKCHCKRGVTVKSVTVSREICTTL